MSKSKPRNKRSRIMKGMSIAIKLILIMIGMAIIAYLVWLGVSIWNWLK